MEIAILLKNRHLRKILSDRAKNNYGKSHDATEPTKPTKPIGSPRLTIHVIFRVVEENGVTFSAARKTKTSVTHGKSIHKIPEDDEITFNKEDADEIIFGVVSNHFSYVGNASFY